MDFLLNLTDGISGPAKNAASGLGGLTDKLGGAEGAMSGLDAVCPGLGEALGVLGPIAIGVAAAFAALVVGSMAMAIHASEAKEKLSGLFDALGEGKITGKQTIAMLDGLADSLGSTRAALAPLAQKFLAMGVTGVDALKGLTTAAASAGALAEGGGEAFTKMFAKISAATATGQALKIPLKGLASLASMGLNVDDVSKKMGISSAQLGAQLKSGAVNATKFGDALQEALIDKGAGPLQRAGASLTNIWTRFGENVTKMFEDVDVGPFLAQVKDLFSIFSQGTSSGQAMKAGIGGALDGLFKISAKVFPYIKHFFLDLEIAALKLYIHFAPLIKQVAKLFGGGEGGDKITPLIDGLVVGLANVITNVGDVVIWLVKAYASVRDFGAGVGAAIAGAIGFFTTLGDAIKGIFTGGNTIAADFVQGLINGITGKIGDVVQSTKDLAKAALGGIKNVLGIASPSKATGEIAGHTVSGFQNEIEASTPAVQGAMADMAAPPPAGKVGGAKAGGASGASAGGQVSITIAAGAIVITGVKDAAEASDAMLSKLADTFEQLGLQVAA